jgi:radical SAM protein with 4Fe4S-binding SPASM domain|tara:strand:- start:1188 stop:2372 length:1185 start_codon:yes stop_codon:yes gene_type:complete
MEKNSLITVNPKIKRKGFNNDNINILAFTKEDTAVYNRILRMTNTPYYKDLDNDKKKLVDIVIESYKYKMDGKTPLDKHYILSGHELVEFESIHDWELFRYIIYRYKYNKYPELKIYDDYPPCLQIEPASVCNFKCVFCYQADRSFSASNKGYMGMMDLDLFKNVIDEVEGNIESITLASRGEPTLNRSIDKMLEYCNDKFLGMKINTNASLLTDKMIHTILSNDVQTVAFSIDAADKELYEKLRVNGKFEKTLRNVERFNEIKAKDYPTSRVVTRISGVKVNEMQDVDKQVETWSQYADIVAFTNYIPWESSYENKLSGVEEPCTELWRRMFVWWDGIVNPCDYDYKSTLSKWNVKNKTVSEIWKSSQYNELRQKHLDNKRNEIEPCKRCIMA